ncbi:MAG: LysR family transcriptional regulator [Burkholderiales bacterium]|nr:LysR family transcriptional regulator [Burkholderiales bacterium]
MRLTLDALQVLDAIDRKGSFAAAAEELFRVPSAITYTVQKLEQDLAVALFDRTGHKAVLTPAGQALLLEGRQLLRAAQLLESRVQRVATGYETELTIAVSDVIGTERLFPLLEDFYREPCGTEVKLINEVYGGSWDALVTGRADLSIGAPGEGPAGGGYSVRPMGLLEFVFAVAPNHPLAQLPEPLSSQAILQYRAISAADSSRHLAPRTSGLLTGQEVLSVPDMRAKLAAHVAGLGVGYLPLRLAREAVQAGQLVIRQVAEPKPAIPLHLAWRTDHAGRALAWFVERLEREALLPA